MSRARAGVDWGRVGYGADLQGERLVLVRAERTRARVQVTACSPDDVRWREDVARGVPVAASLGPRESITQWLDVAFTARPKVLKVLPTVLDIQLPFPLEACVYEFLALRRGEVGHTRALGVAARVSDMERKLARLAAAGVDPTLLDQEGLALWGQSLTELAAPPGDAGVVRVVAYEGTDRTTLAIGVGAEFRAAYAVRLDDGAQVRRLVRAAAGTAGGAVTWCWAGPGATERGAGEPIPGGLGDGWVCRSAVHRDPVTFLARALATRVVRVDPWCCNLRQGSLEHASLARWHGQAGRRAAALVLAAGLVLCGVNAGATWFMRSRAADFERAFGGMAREVAGVGLGAARGEQALLIVKRRVAEQQVAVRPYAEYLGAEGSRTLAAIMAAAAEHALVLEQIVLKGERIVVGGRGADWDRAKPLEALLQGLGLKTRLEREPVLPDGAVPFTLTGEVTRE